MDPTTDQLFLLNNIKSVDGKTIAPSEITLDTTTNAYPLFKNKQGKLIAAGGFLNKGRIVTFAHEAIVNYGKDSTENNAASLTKNAVKWLGRNATRVGMLVSRYNGLRTNLTTAGMTVSDVTPAQLSTVDVVFTDTYTNFDDTKMSQIRAFISGGGGLLYGGHNWYYKHAWVNNILQGTGITITQVQVDGYQVFAPVPPVVSASVPHLIKGVSKITLDGLTPGTLSLFDTNAFSFIDRDRNVIAAGAHFELGRMVHFGHEAVVNIRSTTDNSLLLVKNTISWLTRTKSKASVGFLVTSNGLKTTLTELGHTVTNINIGDDFSGYDLLVTTTYKSYTKDQLQKIEKFVGNGGSLLTGGHNWSGAKAYVDILMPGGIYLTNDYTGGAGLTVTSRTIESQNMLNAYNCINALTAHVKKEHVLTINDQRDVMVTVRYGTNELPSTIDKFWTACKDFLKLHQSVSITSLDTNASPVEASYVYIFNAVVENEDVNSMKQYPEAKDFPGAVPSTLSRTSKTINIDATFTGLPNYFPSHSNAVWRSTALYAGPSEPITVTVSTSAVNKGIRVLIGCHVDNLTKKDTLHRYPRISRSFEIVSTTTKAGNVFGGLIYITVPSGSTLGTIQVSIQNAYAAPEFILGTTNESQWKTSLSANPVPFCEMASKSMILTVQTSEVASRVKNPTDLMQIYRSCVDVINELSALDPNNRARGERFVLDKQISAGYMHAGYPIMGPISASTFMLDNDKIREDGNIWGPVHEIGHQYQTKGWTPSGGGEATTNIFSVYASEKVLKIPRERAHSALTAANRQKRIDDFIKNGRKYSDWTVWTCLETYLQLQEAFGWDFYIKILGEYNKTMTNRPSSNQQMLDEWLKRSSRIANYNLAPFYQGWGWSISQDAINSVANLPQWTKNPMTIT
ncbi:TRPM8 channel-associated factor homolog [Antedon mediterranea]|uniref:TRPM8 channel-associated factor homolog n=1 Tax=Antedon mediterranea TaxID=105859 RepID=UPI003AF909AE